MSARIVLAPDAPLTKEGFEALVERFAHEGERLHKARNEIRVLEHDGRRYVIKAFRPPSLLRRLGYALRRTKAEASYQNSLRLLALGIAAPRPVGYMLKRKKNRLFSYYVSLYHPHDFTLQKPLRDPDFPQRTAILQAFGRFTAQLHRKGVWHRDYSQGNILVSEKRDGWSFALVDVNRMRFGNVSAKEGPRNFAKLWVDQETMEILVRAYAEATGVDHEAALRTALRADAAVKRAKNFRRNLRKKFRPA